MSPNKYADIGINGIHGLYKGIRDRRKIRSRDDDIYRNHHALSYSLADDVELDRFDQWAAANLRNSGLRIFPDGVRSVEH